MLDHSPVRSTLRSSCYVFDVYFHRHPHTSRKAMADIWTYVISSRLLSPDDEQLVVKYNGDGKDLTLEPLIRDEHGFIPGNQRWKLNVAKDITGTTTVVSVDEPTQQAVPNGDVVIAATPVRPQYWEISNSSPGLEGKRIEEAGVNDIHPKFWGVDDAISGKPITLKTRTDTSTQLWIVLKIGLLEEKE
ncbi:hypothetical protein BS47DRAFT_530183 [Hydnum rufescens UP504]|uniref:CCL2-like lectin domain-containing protein n=1 Tax=Hydnum rufescens UP504 TaxID=1448309 RepID=A0A9P6B460_9AGAM|nr:hypothetical protein BS47DRAFT_530183 [Hydnum rufescens UP504]